MEALKISFKAPTQIYQFHLMEIRNFFGDNGSEIRRRIESREAGKQEVGSIRKEAQRSLGLEWKECTKFR